MCGIYCAVSADCHIELDAESAGLLARRGPDAFQTHNVVYETTSRAWYLTFTSSVLSLRGDDVQVQPVIDATTGSVFCWNGEAWLLGNERIPGSDTQAIFKCITAAQNSFEGRAKAIVETLGSIKGPFAFVYYDAPGHTLYYGRDVLGRRSLLVHDTLADQHELTISSADFIGKESTYQEVPVARIFSIDLDLPTLRVESHALNTWEPKINKSLPSPKHVLDDMPTKNSVTSVLQQLSTSLRLRVEAIPTYTVLNHYTNPCKVAVLFSGGLDCTLLTRLLDQVLPPEQSLDLLNVAFENPRVIRARAQENSKTPFSEVDGYEACPDRMTGRSSFLELSQTCPGRLWRFVAINVPFQEFLQHRPYIIQLMYPHNTEMDLSITAALYFAARGTGMITTNYDKAAVSYTTSARVLLSGLGADELFGGYARHAAAFMRGSYSALNEELELDYSRIGSRNLGRDDRVISHWGRETRYPFLDEDFVEFTLGLPSWEKCGFRSEKSIPKHFEDTLISQEIEDLHPEKLLLRCALWQSGMKRAATEKKRAIQFGARTAKMYGGKSKGTDVIARGIST